MRNLGLLMARWRFFLRNVCVHPMKRSRGASVQAAALKPSMARGQPLFVVDGVAHLRTDQGLVAEIVVADDELVPQLALAGWRARRSGAGAGGPRRGLSVPARAALRCPDRRRWGGADPASTSAVAG